MSNRIPRITKRSVDAVKVGGADAVYWDGELTGFGLRVRRSGRKSYVVQTASPGNCAGSPSPAWTAETRLKHVPARWRYWLVRKKGIDPRDAAAQREAEPSMADLGRRFLEEYVPVHCKPSTRKEYRRSVKLFVDHAIGELRVPRGAA